MFTVVLFRGNEAIRWFGTTGKGGNPFLAPAE
jgi:hypothetical protein